MPFSLPRRQNANMILGQLYTNDITDSRLLRALSDIPRELFIPATLSGAAYTDEDIEVLPGRFMLAPLTFARLIALSEIAAGSRVLIVGGLGGYSAAVVSRLASHVVMLESAPEGAAHARSQIKRLGIINVDVQEAPSLAEGCPSFAPYDVILVEGALEVIPEPLLTQLAQGGRLAAILKKSSRPGLRGGLGRGLLARRENGRLQQREHFDAHAPLLPGFERKAGFTL